LAALSFSAVLFADDTMMTDASHPCTRHSRRQAPHTQGTQGDW
jgi:hypothetical protein